MNTLPIIESLMNYWQSDFKTTLSQLNNIQFIGIKINKKQCLQTWLSMQRIHSTSNFIEFLINAVQKGNVQIVKTLLHIVSDINEYYYGAHVLVEACCQGNLQIVELLLNAGADLHISHNHPLESAIENNHIHIVKFLLSMGARNDETWNVALSLAVYNDNLEMVNLLLPITSQKKKCMALERAMYHKRFELAKVLRNAGAV